MSSFLWESIKPLLFSMDAETVHRVTVRMILAGHTLGPGFLRFVSGTPSGALPAPGEVPTEVMGLKFRNRVGLAAGFDKDAEIVTALPSLGFGFAEIGTVTPRPQPGNDRPRLFRDPSRQAIFNRMGFNGQGAAVVSRRLAEAREGLPSDFRVGVNLGKNKDTSLENAALDYADAARAFRGLADYLVINVSSPNTPGLRSLQTQEALRPIVAGVAEVISDWSARPPLLLKLAPEIIGDELGELMRAVESWGIDGWVLTNTLGGTHLGLPGGWSGGPLRDEARKRLQEARSFTRLPIISVGGILDPQEASVRRGLGADLIQIYSGWIYGGPGFPSLVAAALK